MFVWLASDCLVVASRAGPVAAQTAGEFCGSRCATPGHPRRHQGKQIALSSFRVWS